jgi:hypothetical protein
MFVATVLVFMGAVGKNMVNNKILDARKKINWE